MVKVTFMIVVLFLILSCKGYYLNDCGRVEPKNPKYKLKGGFNTIQSHLDTNNVYRLIGYFDKNNKEVKVTSLENLKFYIKFLSDGTFNIFNISQHDTLKRIDIISKCNNLGYYKFHNDGYRIKTESFVVGGGASYYLIQEFLIKGSGDTLINVDNNLYHQVFVREIMLNNVNKLLD